MFSQSLGPQLLRMSLLLMITLYGVHHYQPLLDALANNAVNAGCHQQSSYQQDSSQHGSTEQHSHHHMDHH